MKILAIEPLEARIAPATLSIASVSLNEGNSGVTTFDFTVTLTGDITENVTVNYATADGTATSADADYLQAASQLTFTPGATTQTQTISVSVMGDNVREQNQAFFVNLSGALGATIAQGQATGTIQSEELPTLSIDDPAPVDEGGTGGGGSIGFTVTLDGQINGPVTVAYTTANGTATLADNDYVAKSGTLTFNPGATVQTQNVTVQIVGDGNAENNETLLLNLSNPVGGATIAKASGTGTIRNDELVVYRVDNPQIVEGDAGEKNLVFTVTLLGEPAGDVLVNYATLTEGTATPGVDYEATQGQFTFVRNETKVHTVSVPINGDVSAEQDEQFTLRFTNRNNIEQTRGTGTIVDDDVPAVSISNVTVHESDAGTQTAIFAVRLLRTFSEAVKVTYQTEDGAGDTGAKDGSADDGGIAADYVASAGELTFAAGETVKTIAITINNDTIRELAQNFFNVRLLTAMAGTAPLVIGDNPGVGTIIDNGDAAPTLSINDVTAIENGNATFTASLSQKSDLPVTFDYATLAGSALAGSDFNAAAGTLTFAPATTTRTIDVALTADGTVEADETFSVKLTNAQIGATGAQQPLTIVDDTGVGTIRNDDVEVSIAGGTIAEDGGSLNFTVTLSAPAVTDVVVRYSTLDSTAVAPGDFTAAANQQIIILAGATSGIISIPITNDTTHELDESFTVQLGEPTNAVRAATNTAAAGIITNDDAVPTLSINDVTVAEGDAANPTAKFTVTLSAASSQTIKVDYITEDVAGNDGAKDGVSDTLAKDYTAVTGTLTFAPGEVTKTIEVAITNDAVREALENLFSVKLSNARVDLADPSADLPVTMTDDTGTGTITDTGDALPTLSVADVTVAENGGNAVFAVKLSSVSDLPVTVAFATVDDSAVAGSDYTATSSTVTFEPGTITMPVSVAMTPDTDPETDEQFFLSLTNPTNATLVDGLAVGRIQNDDATLKIVAFDDPSVSTLTVAEDGGSVAKFKVILEGATPGATTTVQYATVANTAGSTGARPDFTAQSGTLVFNGTNELIIEVPIVADANYETNEQFSVVLSDAVNAVVATSAGSGVVTITNNDAKPTLTIEDVTVVEGNVTGANDTPVQTKVTFKAKLSAANEVDLVTVIRATEDGTAVSTGTRVDFTPLLPTPVSAATITFNRGDLEKTIDVTVLGDLRDENDETFKLKLSSLLGATFAGDATEIFATGTITDDDAAPFVSISPVTVAENASAQFKVALYNAAGKAVESEKQITVDFATLQGTAKAGIDFTTTNGTMTFAPGTKEQIITVPVLNDAITEDAETFTVTLSNALGAPLGATTATGTITDNDAATRPVITINDFSIVEGDAGTSNAVFTVSLSGGATSQTITVNFATGAAADTAKATGPFADYLATAGTLTFDPNDPDPARRVTQTIVVPVIGDLFTEADEVFSVVLSGAVNATIADGTGTVTILNGGDTKLGLALLDAQTVEGSGSNKNLTFTAQLSGPATSPVTFKLSTLNGTALSNVDFLKDPEDKTIAIGATTATFDVLIGGDSEWEATESFFVNLTNASANVEVVDSDPIGAAQATARGYIFNDDINFISGKKIQWIDVDGDLVTLTVNKGSLVLNANSLDTNLENDDDISLVAEGSVGGRELQQLIFANDGTLYQGVTLSIIATKQPGFPLESDGRVDVGWIAGTSFLGDVVQVVGVDFASLTVDGDVAKITAGDTFSTPAIGKLDVYSLGARGTTTGAPDTESRVIGPITSVNVKQNVEGFLNVIGDRYGNIGTLKVDGALKGGAADVSGVVQVSGRINTATIGSIIGGAGANSGLIVAEAITSSGIGTIKILGDIVGGSGNRSGAIVANKIGNVTLGGGIIGGSGAQSGLISSNTTLGNVTIGGDLVGGGGATSGQIFSPGKMGAVRVEGSIVGGAGQNSGTIFTQSDLTSLKIDGGVLGGSGVSSGAVRVGGKLGATTIGVLPVLEGAPVDSIVGGSGASSGLISTFGNVASLATEGNIRGGNGSTSGALVLRGTVAKLTVGGDLIGGVAPEPTPGQPAPTISGSGLIQAGKLTSGLIAGSVFAGPDVGANVSGNGSIGARQIDSLTINGNLVGTADTNVVIAALGESAAPAIRNLLIKGDVFNSFIIAGLDVGVRDGAAEKRNADASIGNVTVNGSVLGLAIAAGAEVGADGRFGTADDRLISGTGVTDVAKTISQIASVIIKGQILDGGAYGVIAQHIVSVKVGPNGAPVALLKGPGNDVATSDTDPDPGTIIGPNFRAIELPLPV